MSEHHATTYSPRDLFGLASWHSKKIWMFCVLTFSVAVGIILFYPRSYVSEAKLYVRIGRENATLDPTATTGETVAVRIDRQNEINSLLDVMESRGIAERVVDVVGVERVVANGSTSAVATASSGFSLTQLFGSFQSSLKRLKALVSDPVSDREIAVRSVERMTEVRAPRESTVITILCTAGSPKLAQEIASAMTDVFLKEHLRLNRTKGTHQFFTEQSRLLHEQLTKASQELADRKSEFGLLAVEGKRQIIEEQLKIVRLELLGTERALTASQTKVRNLQDTVASLSPQVTQTMTGVSHQAWDRMREKLYELEIVESELRSLYTDKHPKMSAVAEQRRNVSEILKSQPQDRTQITSIQNPTYQALEQELLSEQANVASLQSTKQVLAQQHANVLEEVESLNNQDYQIAELERQLELLESNYRTHAEKLEEARIDEALDTARVSSINIAQRATFVGKSVSPDKRLTLLAAVAVSLFGGLGLALFGESLNQTLRTPGEAEAVLDLPVLVSIPKTRRHRFITN